MVCACFVIASFVLSIFTQIVLLPLPLSPGYFSLLSLALGCRVVAFEPQQRLWPIIAKSLHFNSFKPKDFALVPCALSDATPEPASLDCLLATEHSNWGEWSLQLSQVGVHQSNSEASCMYNHAIFVQ